ncbi:MAG: iron complex outermembrane receptor protein [Halioglobus sp.]|jgi:iron complex outermembrane receptor protein
MTLDFPLYKRISSITIILLIGVLIMRVKKITKFHRAHLPLAVLLAYAIPSLAQSADAGSGTRTWQLEETVVTARKKEENLQDAPISISAFSGQALEDRGVQKLIEIENFTPNLTFQNNPSFGGASSAAAIYIRGIGQKEFLPTVEPGVGLYVDGIYIARSVGAILDLIEVERVEVLRGPQGTLFGRNSIGGAISITTKKPDDFTWRSVEERYTLIVGGKNLTDEKFMISGIIGDAFQSYEAVYSRGREYYLSVDYNFGDF